MSACLETSLYIGVTKTRFDLFDEVKLKLKNGKVIKGTITEFESIDRFYLETEEGTYCINPDDIEGYIN